MIHFVRRRFVRRRSDLAVKGHGGFQGYQRRAVTDVAGEGLVQAASLFLQSADFHVDAHGPQFFESASTHFGIGIGHGRDHAMNARGNQRLGTWRRTALMGVRFEIDVKRCAPSFGAGRFESKNLSMFHAAVGVGSGADDVALGVGDHRADMRVGRGEADASAREFESAVEKLFVGSMVGHENRYLPRRHGGTAGRRARVHVVGKRRLDCPPRALPARLPQIFLLAAFRGAPERMKTDLQQARPVLLGEEVCSKTNQQVPESQEQSGLQGR